MLFQWECIKNYDEYNLQTIMNYIKLREDSHINWSGNCGEYISYSIIDGYIFDYKGHLYSCC